MKLSYQLPIQIARIVVSTHQREKLDYLRNALLNIALGKGVGEIKQQVFLNAVEAFTPAHVKILNLIWRSLNPGWDQHSVPPPLRTYSRAIELIVPEVQGQTCRDRSSTSRFAKSRFYNARQWGHLLSAGRVTNQSNARISSICFKSPRSPAMRGSLPINAHLVPCGLLPRRPTCR